MIDSDHDTGEKPLRRRIFWSKLGISTFLACVAWVLPGMVHIAGGTMDHTITIVMLSLAALLAISGVATLLGYPIGGD